MHTHLSHPKGWYAPNIIRAMFRPVSSILYPIFQVPYFRLLHGLAATKGAEHWVVRNIINNLWLNVHGGHQTTREEIYQMLENVALEDGTTFVLAKCLCRIALHNKYEDWCILLGDVAKSWLRFRKAETRVITLEEVRGILKKAKDKKLVSCPYICTSNRLYGICNCDPWDCLALHLEVMHGLEMGVLPGIYVPHIKDNCRLNDGCAQECKKYCYFKAIAVGESWMVVNENKCHGCGLCYENCPYDAIELRKEREKILNWHFPYGL